VYETLHKLQTALLSAILGVNFETGLEVVRRFADSFWVSEATTRPS